MKNISPEDQLAAFIAKYAPEIAEQVDAVLQRMRSRLPGALELVYDNYNALACGFAPNERASDGIFSIAVYPKNINFFFLQGAKIPDPDGMLHGAGSRVRYVPLENEKTLDRADVKAMMTTAMKMAKVPFDKDTKYKLVIKSVSAKQRPRRTDPTAINAKKR